VLPGKGQVDAQIGSAIKRIGVVAQEDIHGVRDHQSFLLREILANRCRGFDAAAARLVSTPSTLIALRRS